MEYFPQLMLGITVISAVWGHAIWLSTRFATISKEMDNRFEKLLATLTAKIEYHERHDDRRFAQINDGLWEIRLQSAIQTGSLVAQKKKINSDPSREGGEETCSGDES
jgi:hypothetical protein